MRAEEKIRDMILFQKERLLHENPSPPESIPHQFYMLDDAERRGMIRALRWVVNTEDELV